MKYIDKQPIKLAYEMERLIMNEASTATNNDNTGIGRALHFDLES